MEIRPFGTDDEAAVVALWKSCDLVRPWNDPHKDIARKLALQPELFFVGLVDGCVVASVIVGYEGHRGWINYLAVAPGLRRHGLGRRLMEHAASVLRERGCPKINLQVTSTNAGVIEFYRRLGYVEDDVVSFGKRLEQDDLD